VKPVNEGSSCTATVKFYDTTGAAFIPNNAKWRLTDSTNNRLLQDWQDISSLDSTVVLEIPFNLNTIYNDRNLYEERTITVQADTGNESSQFSEEVRYKVRNLRGFR
jgi:hypothetical protein